MKNEYEVNSKLKAPYLIGRRRNIVLGGTLFIDLRWLEAVASSRTYRIEAERPKEGKPGQKWSALGATWSYLIPGVPHCTYKDHLTSKTAMHTSQKEGSQYLKQLMFLP
jgi:hypothetical protein